MQLKDPCSPQTYSYFILFYMNDVKSPSDVKRWSHAWLVIMHVHVHVADDVLYDFIKLTKVNTERRSNAARMHVQH